MTLPAQSAATAEPSGQSLFSAFLPLLPFMAAVFVGFFAIGMALPVVPRHVHDTLGQGTVVVGFVMGIQYLTSVFGRMGAGVMTDARGPRVVTLAGLLAVAGIGACYLASVPLIERAPQASLALVIVGRLLNGIAESFIITSTMTWGLARVGPAHAGKVFGWIGMALFAGLAAGAPTGMAWYGRFGFGGVALAVLVVALAGLAGTSFIAGVKPGTAPRVPFQRVLGAVQLPGAGLMLASIGYGMVTTFAVLLFAQRGWDGGALAVSCMGLGFIVARLFFGHLPDQAGGARVTVAALVVQTIGLVMIWLAPAPVFVWVGAMFAGGGYALSFQGFGVEAVRRTPPQSRGSAMGAYVLFQDMAMGLGGPLGGMLARAAGLDAVYLAAAIGSMAAGAVALMLLVKAPATASA